MAYIIKPMTTEAEMRGKAYVHYAAWLETYPGLMPREYLEQRSLQKCEETAWPSRTTPWWLWTATRWRGS